MKDDRLRKLFQEMREEALPADSLARVRLRVAARVAARRRWKLAALVLAPLCALLMFALLRIPASVPPPRVVADKPRDVTVEPAVILSTPHAAPRRKRVAQRVPSALSTTVNIRIETQDPEVVILLVGN